MAFDFHNNKQEYFNQQKINAATYVIPFIEQMKSIGPNTSVLEIGCAEGGVLMAFLEKGCTGVGVELMPGRLEQAKIFLEKYAKDDKVELINKNIYDVDLADSFANRFDIIVLKDVIEHIFDQEKLFLKMKEFLKPGGQIFFGFPPWQMPFGGHQQICKGNLSKFPYFHLLPMSVYKWVLKLGGESQGVIDSLVEIKETQISIGQFEGFTKKTGYKIISKQLFFINPIYIYKFGIKAKKQNVFLGSIPFLRNFVTTCGYYTIAIK